MKKLRNLSRNPRKILISFLHYAKTSQLDGTEIVDMRKLCALFLQSQVQNGFIVNTENDK